LALGEAVGLGAFVNPLVAALLALLTFALGRMCFHRDVAIGATLLLATSSFFILNGSTFYSHPTSALGVMGVVLSTLRYRATDRRASLVVACLSWSLVFLARPWTAVIAFLGGAPFALHHVYRRRDYKGLAFGTLGLLVGPALYLTYNRVVRGSAGSTGYGGTEVGSWRPFVWTTFANQSWELPQVSWPWWGWLIALAGLVLLYKRRDQRDALVLPTVSIAPVVTMAVVMWFSHTMRTAPLPIHYGPRYIFAGFPFLCLLAALGLRAIVFDRRVVYWAVIAALVVVQLFTAVPQVLQVGTYTYEIHRWRQASEQLGEVYDLKDYRVAAMEPTATCPSRARRGSRRTTSCAARLRWGRAGG
jgi:hypothetical protein